MTHTLVWLKRDLRFYDHRPLYEATLQSERVTTLYIYEPEWFNSYEFDSSHLEFVNQSLRELIAHFTNHRINFITRVGEAAQVLRDLHAESPFAQLFSHQETGNLWTFERDLRVRETLKLMGVEWREFQQFAVTRRLKNREDWKLSRKTIIERALLAHPKALTQMSDLRSRGLLRPKDLSLEPCDKDIPRGGVSASKECLESFLGFRSKNYLVHISDPHFSQTSSSRLSPYITFGNLSLTQIHHRLSAEKKNKASDHWWLRSLEAFESRTWWHCHFVQKLETQFSLEFENANRAFDGLRENDFNPNLFEAWCKGETGYPLIDACMRSLQKTGWLNFRMRAMLVSFASYQLWLDWRVTSHFLAKHFLDFEAGIHFSQFQMQSGVTGINSIRIYSPLKQSEDQKGALEFVRRWVPELDKVPDEFVLFPSHMPPMLQMMSEFVLGRDYPHPIVDPIDSYERAKKRIFEWRELPEVKKLSKGVLERHHGKGASRTKS